MRKLSFEETRQLQFELLLELDSFCRRNGLTYFLAYGSLLGAVRHGGFIPWDDDVDVIMPIGDIDRLEQTYKSENYSVITCNNSKEHVYPFARLYNNTTYSKVGRFKSFGIGIDIYPMYNAPIDNQDRYVGNICKLTHQRLFLIRMQSFLVQHKLWFKETLSSPLITWYSKRMIEFMRSYHNVNTGIVFINSGEKHIIRKDSFFPAGEIVFNGRKFLAPNKVDEILSIWYGDYMQLPPEDKRVPYHGGEYYKYQ